MSCRIGLRSRPSAGAGHIRANGFDVARMKIRKTEAIQPCTASTVACSVAGRRLPNIATRAPNSVRMNTHRTIEPSWLPHVAVSR